MYTALPASSQFPAMPSYATRVVFCVLTHCFKRFKLLALMTVLLLLMLLRLSQDFLGPPLKGGMYYLLEAGVHVALRGSAR